MRFSKPTVGIPVDVKQIGIHPFHVVGEKYIDAVARGAGCFLRCCSMGHLIPLGGGSVTW